MLRRRAYATYASVAEKSCAQITPPYADLRRRLDVVRAGLNRPLTLAEKILYAHLADPARAVEQGIERGQSYLQLNPQRVAMQDASAQMALLQFMSAGLDRCAVPTSIHCDHLIQANVGADADLQRSITANQEVFDFLESAARKYGIAFWPPGSGIIHQIVLENYAAPGMLMLGTDSHTPNAGGLGLLAIAPRVLGVHLTGQLDPWATPKDLILHLAGRLTVKGGTGHILEYFGEGVHRQAATGLATIANMGAEVGATTSLSARTGRGETARAAREAANAGYLAADEGAEYDELIEVDLSTIEPTINGPFTPDLATPLSKFPEFAKDAGYTENLSAALIGSCTELIAHAAGLKAKVPFLVTPGSEQIRAPERDGVTGALEAVGATVLANACGPCIGQWKRGESEAEKGDNAILTSFNRNFRSRNDGNARTMNFLASPVLVTAAAFVGRVGFDPRTETIDRPGAPPFRFSPPTATDLPPAGFAAGNAALYPDADPQPDASVNVVIKEDSQRLEKLDAFGSHFGPHNPRGLELPALQVLMRVRGKCTTDHISAAGPWLKYKGHLTNISENLLITANNDELDDVNVALDPVSNPWALIVDENYGEGSAREHAALQPRFYGCALVVARSFAQARRLPLWFADKTDYAKIGAGDLVETEGLADLLEGNNDATLHLKVTNSSGEVLNIPVTHTMSADQLKWLRSGARSTTSGLESRRGLKAGADEEGWA
ncbi:hypothetical protein BD626DRAFT_558525 [Schizophyllum amplum]|uniref:Aconitate hydratase, mitochondrial n=1 Tax=Schizophyllum amplum TaxID=97359 RepID=A0A550C9K5_9AGAR|nr:hypothetical protein BD626DRAFT_558525 [Auriculariopsis ampla]